MLEIRIFRVFGDGTKDLANSIKILRSGTIEKFCIGNVPLDGRMDLDKQRQGEKRHVNAHWPPLARNLSLFRDRRLPTNVTRMFDTRISPLSPLPSTTMPPASFVFRAVRMVIPGRKYGTSA